MASTEYDVVAAWCEEPEEVASLLNDVSQRHQNPITEEYVRDMRPVQVLTKRSHSIPSLHNVGFNSIDVGDVAWFTANISR